MRRLDLYVARTSLAAMAFVLCLLALLNVLFGLLEHLLAGDALAVAAMDVAARLPQRLLATVPFVALIGSLVGLGTLAATNEVVAMRVAGVSVYRLAAAAALPGVVLAALVFAVAEWWLPNAGTQDGGSAVDGVHWYQEGGHYFVIGGHDAEGLLAVSELRFADDGALRELHTASRARAANDGWQLHDVTITRRTDRRADEVAPDRVSVVRQALAPSLLRADRTVLLQSLARSPEQLSTPVLLSRLRDSAGVVDVELALWRRYCAPLSVMALVLLGAASVLGPLRETGLGVRLAAGLGIGLLFHFLGELLGPLALVGVLPVSVAVLLPLAVAAGAAWSLLRRAA